MRRYFLYALMLVALCGAGTAHAAGFSVVLPNASVGDRVLIPLSLLVNDVREVPHDFAFTVEGGGVWLTSITPASGWSFQPIDRYAYGTPEPGILRGTFTRVDDVPLTSVSLFGTSYSGSSTLQTSVTIATSSDVHIPSAPNPLMIPLGMLELIATQAGNASLRISATGSVPFVSETQRARIAAASTTPPHIFARVTVEPSPATPGAARELVITWEGGAEHVPVEFSVRIVDQNGAEVLTWNDAVVVQGTTVYRKPFTIPKLARGYYMLIVQAKPVAQDAHDLFFRAGFRVYDPAPLWGVLLGAVLTLTVSGGLWYTRRRARGDTPA